MSTVSEHEVMDESRKKKRKKDVFQAEEVLGEKQVCAVLCYHN